MHNKGLYTEVPNSQQNERLRIFGRMQIALGVVSGFLSFVGIILDGINISNDDERFSVYTHARTMVGFDTICLISSAWSIFTGAFPFTMIAKRQHKWMFLKTTYVVLCIVEASVFAPMAFSISVLGAVIRARDSGSTAAIPSFVALISFAELVVAVVAFVYSCCFSDRNTYEPLILTIPQFPVTNMGHVWTGMFTALTTEQPYTFETSVFGRISPPPPYTPENRATLKDIDGDDDEDFICLLDNDLL